VYPNPEIVIRGANTLGDALTRLGNVIDPSKNNMLFYGFAVHSHSAAQNDAIIELSHLEDYGNPDIAKMYEDAGGSAKDIVASRVPNLADPFFMDVTATLDQLRKDSNPAAITMGFMHDIGIRSAWIVPISPSNTGGYGVLNHFVKKKNAPPPMHKEQLVELAHDFHAAARQEGLLAKKLTLTGIECQMLHLLSIGHTAKQIALQEKVTERAIERRLERARKKLSANNSNEAIFKGHVIGALPYAST